MKMYRSHWLRGVKGKWKHLLFLFSPQWTKNVTKVIIPVFRSYKIKNGAKTQINGYASFLFVFQLSNNW